LAALAARSMALWSKSFAFGTRPVLALGCALRWPTLAPAPSRRVPLQARAHVTVDAVIAATAQILLEEGYDACTTNRTVVSADWEAIAVAARFRRGTITPRDAHRVLLFR
jgi:hypothetical protein